jgi:hypothetical protein
LPFFVLDIVCFHGVRLAYWKYLHFSRIRQASRSPSVFPAKGERRYRLLLARIIDYQIGIVIRDRYST